MSDEQHPETPSGSGSSLANLVLFGLLMIGGAIVFRQLLVKPDGLMKTQGPNHSKVGVALKGVEVSPLTNAESSVTPASLAGKVTLINFWGTWCPPCREEMPDLVKLGRVLSDEERFQLVLVSVGSNDVNELRAVTLDYLRSQSWPQQATYHDVNDVAQQQVREVVGIDVNFPTTLVVDQSGAVRGVWEMYFPSAVKQMETLVRELLEPQTLEPEQT